MLNNSFFLDTLVRILALQLLLCIPMGPFAEATNPDYPNHEKDISPELMSLIYESFDDLEGLKSYLHVRCCPWNDWVWLGLARR